MKEDNIQIKTKERIEMRRDATWTACERVLFSRERSEICTIIGFVDGLEVWSIENSIFAELVYLEKGLSVRGAKILNYSSERKRDVLVGHYPCVAVCTFDRIGNYPCTCACILSMKTKECVLRLEFSKPVIGVTASDSYFVVSLYDEHHIFCRDGDFKRPLCCVAAAHAPSALPAVSLQGNWLCWATDSGEGDIKHSDEMIERKTERTDDGSWRAGKWKEVEMMKSQSAWKRSWQQGEWEERFLKVESDQEISRKVCEERREDEISRFEMSRSAGAKQRYIARMMNDAGLDVEESGGWKQFWKSTVKFLGNVSKTVVGSDGLKPYIEASRLNEGGGSPARKAQIANRRIQRTGFNGRYGPFYGLPLFVPQNVLGNGSLAANMDPRNSINRRGIGQIITTPFIMPRHIIQPFCSSIIGCHKALPGLMFGGETAKLNSHSLCLPQKRKEDKDEVFECDTDVSSLLRASSEKSELKHSIAIVDLSSLSVIFCGSVCTAPIACISLMCPTSSLFNFSTNSTAASLKERRMRNTTEAMMGLPPLVAVAPVDGRSVLLFRVEALFGRLGGWNYSRSTLLCHAPRMELRNERKLEIGIQPEQGFMKVEWSDYRENSKEVPFWREGVEARLAQPPASCVALSLLHCLFRGHTPALITNITFAVSSVLPGDVSEIVEGAHSNAFSQQCCENESISSFLDKRSSMRPSVTIGVTSSHGTTHLYLVQSLGAEGSKPLSQIFGMGRSFMNEWNGRGSGDTAEMVFESSKFDQQEGKTCFEAESEEEPDFIDVSQPTILKAAARIRGKGSGVAGQVGEWSGAAAAKAAEAVSSVWGWLGRKIGYGVDRLVEWTEEKMNKRGKTLQEGRYKSDGDEREKSLQNETKPLTYSNRMLTDEVEAGKEEEEMRIPILTPLPCSFVFVGRNQISNWREKMEMEINECDISSLQYSNPKVSGKSEREKWPESMAPSTNSTPYLMEKSLNDCTSPRTIMQQQLILAQQATTADSDVIKTNASCRVSSGSDCNSLNKIDEQLASYPSLEKIGRAEMGVIGQQVLEDERKEIGNFRVCVEIAKSCMNLVGVCVEANKGMHVEQVKLTQQVPCKILGSKERSVISNNGWRKILEVGSQSKMEVERMNEWKVISPGEAEEEDLEREREGMMEEKHETEQTQQRPETEQKVSTQILQLHHLEVPKRQQEIRRKLEEAEERMRQWKRNRRWEEMVDDGTHCDKVLWGCGGGKFEEWKWKFWQEDKKGDKNETNEAATCIGDENEEQQNCEDILNAVNRLTEGKGAKTMKWGCVCSDKSERDAGNEICKSIIGECGKEQISDPEQNDADQLTTEREIAESVQCTYHKLLTRMTGAVRYLIEPGNELKEVGKEKSWSLGKSLRFGLAWKKKEGEGEGEEEEKEEEEEEEEEKEEEADGGNEEYVAVDELKLHLGGAGMGIGFQQKGTENVLKGGRDAERRKLNEACEVEENEDEGRKWKMKTKWRTGGYGKEVPFDNQPLQEEQMVGSLRKGIEREQDLVTEEEVIERMKLERQRKMEVMKPPTELPPHPMAREVEYSKMCMPP
eukprot:MONOS_12054.1-p1 / transcript=MONOS_12054.1 / gene=MONOS_12054 / organism=Monocercomonoides_exilis_PA203 / gene_product=unspecified product / transcript_product=unspecified product / location=Mono_scaffold00640:9893-15211(-) / protein_length=1555 / sequence_SO=supercontig / SO=protein_coding / is_pseudo=false